MEDTNQLSGLWSYKKQHVILPTPHSLLRKQNRESQCFNDWLNAIGLGKSSADMGIERCWHNRKIICLLKGMLFAFIPMRICPAGLKWPGLGDRTQPSTGPGKKVGCGAPGLYARVCVSLAKEPEPFWKTERIFPYASKVQGQFLDYSS